MVLMSHFYHIHHFRHNAINLNSLTGTCFLFKDVNLVSADKKFVDAKIVRQDESLCGSDGIYFEN